MMPGRTKSIAVSHIEGTEVGYSDGRGGQNRLPYVISRGPRLGFQLAGEDEIDCFESYEGDQGWVFSWPGRTKSIALSHMKGTKVGFSVGWGGRNRLL